MKILYVSPRQFWPPRSGAKLRDYHFAQALGRHGDLTYAYFLDPDTTPIAEAQLPFCRKLVAVPKPATYSPGKIARGLFGRWPLPVLNYSSPQMDAVLCELTAKTCYDLVHFDSIHMISYTATVSTPTARIVYNWHNIESEAMRRFSTTASSRLRRIYATLTARQLERLERKILAEAFGHVVCSRREQQQLLDVAPQARVAVIDNGVDTDYFSHAAGPGMADQARTRIVFVGLMNYYPNVEAATSFAHTIWPRLQQRLPGLRLTIVGASPTPAVLALREIAGVDVTGTVPDVRPYYGDALAAIVPLRTGGGTRLKILEAMAAGVPVVSTTLGAEGLHIQPGGNILIAGVDDTEAWIQAIEALANQPALRRQLIEAAAALVRQRYDWTALGDALCDTYRQWLENAR